MQDNALTSMTPHSFYHKGIPQTVVVAILAGFVLGLGSTPSVKAQTFKVLHAFSGTDGTEPMSHLIIARGLLYGTTIGGGPDNGAGTVFAMNGQGKEMVLYTFTDTGDGANPYAGVIRDAQGNLYGTTYINGLNGGGVVFKISGKTETVLHNFGGSSDGTLPRGDLIRDAAGNLYGTTSEGGTGHCSGGCGTVFKISATGAYSVLYNFVGKPDGSYPYGGLVMDGRGNLYGTTNTGGTDGYGTVFKITRTGQETVLHSFNFTDGDGPYGGLVRDAAGNLYGTTYLGGPNIVGTVFKLDLAGNLTDLYSFSNQADGGRPEAGLVLDPAGNLYGTTEQGGSAPCKCGTVFEVDPSGNETVLYSFTGGADGKTPIASLLRDSAGNLYGTTRYGGNVSGGLGVVFKITP